MFTFTYAENTFNHLISLFCVYTGDMKSGLLAEILVSVYVSDSLVSGALFRLKISYSGVSG